MSCYDNGYLYYLKTKMPVEHDSRIEKVGVVKGYSYPRNLFYQADRRELFVGDGNGIITCLDINKFEAGPIDSVKAHKGEIIWLGHDGEGRIVSTGKDEKMMFWEVPESRKVQKKPSKQKSSQKSRIFDEPRSMKEASERNS